ncbi:hypothetical protein GCM10009560_16140 [Nonomuraea longicatena]|uniref:Uncharacterized protein n=2 Tax=Nonomuraea longicatena TaxID=83682 RepID=A0ABP3ZBC4_9ACTN
MAAGAAAERGYSFVRLDHVDRSGLGDADLIHGLKRDMVDFCRVNRIPRKYITPYDARFGYGFLIVGPTTYNAPSNTITLMTSRGWMDFPLRLGAYGYHEQCLNVMVSGPGRTVSGLGLVIDAIAADYCEGTPTRSMADALTEVIRLVVHARNNHQSVIDGRAVDEALARHLNPHIRAWLGQED